MRINRGKLSLEGVAKKALELDAEKVVIIGGWRGSPGKIEFFRINEKGLDVVPPLIFIKKVKLRRDFEENLPRGKIKPVTITASQRTSLEVKRLENVLSEFFSIPVLSLKEIYNRKYDAAMQISADQSNRITITFKLIPELVEAGPQIRISHLVWKLTR